jgi:hypothetical protein
LDIQEGKVISVKILKISSLVLMVVALIASVSAYRLIGGETFQSYTAWGDGGNETIFFGQSGGVWNCTDSIAYPYCVRDGTVYGTDGTGDINIGKEFSGNKYLNILSIGGDCTKPSYKDVGLDWYSGNSTRFDAWSEGQTYIIRFSYKAVYADNLTGCGGNIYRYRSWLDFSRANIMGSNTYLRMGQGGTNLCSPAVQECWEGFRVWHDTSTNYFQPTNQYIDINDGNWHEIKAVYKINSTRSPYNQTVYVDNVQMWTNSSTVVFSSTDRMFAQPMHFKSFGAFSYYLDNLSLWEANASENFTGDIPLETTSCSDGIDNDYDGFIDYGAGVTNDPECTSFSDTSENPFHYTQCNNDIDDDSDSYIDIDDPSCNGTLTNDNEYPSQASTQEETVCLAEEFCILNEKFPYTDNITLHGWQGNVSTFKVINTLGSGRLYFDNGGSDDFNLWKNISNSNTYNTVQVWFDLAMATKDTWSGTDESIFYVKMLDSDGRVGAYVKFNLTQIDPSSTRCQIYAVDGASEVLVATIFPSLTNGNIVGMKLTVDQVSKQYTVSYRASGEWNEGITSYGYSDASASKIYAFNIEDPFDSEKYDVYMDNINILGADTNFDTNCDTVEDPYKVIESFNGYLAVCGWVTSHNIWNNGYLSLSQATTSYFAQKTFDTISDTESRYTTWMFDLNVINVTAGSTITVRGYDDTDFNFFTIWWMDTGDNLWYNQYGAGSIGTSINLSTVYHVKIIMDFQNDNYDLYLNDSLILDNKGWTKQFYNLQNFESVKFTSARSAFTLDNVIIYTSDADGNPLTGSGSITQPVNNASSMCGLFYKTKPTCSNDEDCITGDCLPNHQCNSFDMTFCDENGYVRGNKCMMAGVASCFFGEATDVIFDNFFYVLVAIIMLIAIVYLTVMLRRR